MREPETFEHVLGPPPGLRLREMVEATNHHDVLEPRQVLVDRRVLPREPDLASKRRGILDHVETGHRGASRVGLDQGGEDPDPGRLARPVRSQQPEHGPGLDLQIDTFERLDVTEPLGDAVSCDDCIRHRASLSTSRRARPGDGAGPPTSLTYPGQVARTHRPASTLRRDRCLGRRLVPRARRTADRVRRAQRRRQDHRDADRARRPGARRGGGPHAGAAGARPRPPQVRLHARGARAVSADARARAARVPGPAPRPREGGRAGDRPRPPRAAPGAGLAERSDGGALVREPTAGAARGGPDPPARGARAGRAVLRARPHGRRRAGRRAAGRGTRARGADRVLEPPARPRRAPLRRGGADRARPDRGGGHDRGAPSLAGPTDAPRGRGGRAGGVVGGRARDQPRGTHAQGVVLAVTDGADPQRVLDVARAHGDVTHFGEVQRSLAELFREFVEEDAAA